MAMMKPELSRIVDIISKMGEDDVMGVPELCAYLGVSKDWVYGRTAKNEIPFFKVGHLVKFRRSDIDRWFSRCAFPAVASLSAPLLGKRAWDSKSRNVKNTPCNIAKS